MYLFSSKTQLFHVKRKYSFNQASYGLTLIGRMVAVLSWRAAISAAFGPSNESPSSELTSLSGSPVSPPPHDARLQIQLERQHADQVYIMWGSLFQSPIRSPRRILEVGCHMGVTTCHLGNMFPAAKVFGIDMKLDDYPHVLERPANVKLVHGDIHDLALRDTRFMAGSQDFIFGRMLMEDMIYWEQYIQNAFHMLAPGGYMEV